ncbi:MAG TPA: ABC transporter substrate-binding protein [Gaiellaceae bacterium]|jgi:putative spermidine/putrescine transport system substrate-binding protein|nr:ABC transporter substrate-binding protein [Gaiellaceae bacterium]
MHDFEAQEAEFWARLTEQGMSRSQMLRRSAAAAVGLTVLAGVPGSALAARARFTGASLPSSGAGFSMSELVSQAKKEGTLNAIALPLDWANYGEIIPTFEKKYGVKVSNPTAAQGDSSAQENQAIVSLKGTSRAPDVVDDGPAFAIQGASQGLFATYKVSEWASIPASQRDAKGRWAGDYWGAISIGYNSKLVNPAPTSLKDLMNSAYKGQVALNGSPLSSGSAVGGVFAAALANGGSLTNVGPGVDFFANLKSSGNFITVESTPQTVASGQTPISIDWDYLNLGYVKEFPAADWKVVIPSDGVYGSYYAQAINATAPNPWMARLWEEFLYSDQGQLLWLKGFSHPIRFQDLSKRKVIPAALLKALPPASLYSKAKFATDAQQTAAKNLIAAQWPAKIGS